MPICRMIALLVVFSAIFAFQAVAEIEGEHEGEHEGEGEVIALDDAALANIGIGDDSMITLTPTTFRRSFTIPGTVMNLPAKSIVYLTAAADGTVTRLDAVPGETLCPGESVLEIMLTHAETIECQSELITLLQQGDLLKSEEARLGGLDPGIAPQAQRELALKKMENNAAVSLRRELLHIHGITDAMIDETIVERREAITHTTVRVPEVDDTGVKRLNANAHEGPDDNAHFLVLERLPVERGDAVSVGDILAEISDLRCLEIEGHAFASDETELNRALLEKRAVTAVFADAVEPGKTQIVTGLALERLDNRVDPGSQSLGCRVRLTNYRLETPPAAYGTLPPFTPGGKEPIHWRFKPGQRCSLEIATETLDNVFVLPPEAVALEHARAVVFEFVEEHEGKKQWRPVSVHVVARSAREIAVAPDEHLQPGTKIAAAGASQLLVALGAGGALQSACEHDHSK